MGVVRGADRDTPESTIPGIRGKPLIDPDTGAGAVTLGELTIEANSLLPLHKHLVEEAFFIFEGTGVALMGEDETPVGAGDAVIAPAGIHHGFRNDSAKPLRMAFFYPAVNPATEFK